MTSTSYQLYKSIVIRTFVTSFFNSKCLQVCETDRLVLQINVILQSLVVLDPVSETQL